MDVRIEQSFPVTMTNRSTVKCGHSHQPVPPIEYRTSDWALPSIVYSCFSPFPSEMP